MNNKLYFSSEIFNTIKPIQKTINFFGLDFCLYESPLFPYDETVPSSDINTREEVRIKTGKQIVGVVLDADYFKNKYINPKREILLIENKKTNETTSI